MQSDDSSRVAWRHVGELDGVRAIAVLIVFASHLGSLGRIIPGGLGVTIFFFLSGYLITSLLRVEAQRNGTINLAEFYLRRTFRIFPPLYVTLAVSALLVVFGLLRVRSLDPGSVTSQILFMSNYERLWGSHSGLPGPPLWSLAVEEHFYLVFPLAFAAWMVRVRPSKAAAWCACACVVPLLARMAPLVFGGDLTLNYFLSHTRADSILAGCVLALWNNPLLDDNAWKPSIIEFAAAVILVLVAALIRSPWFAEVYRYTFQGIGLYVIFAFILRPNRLTSPILLQPALQLVGRLSYSIYLVHVICLMLVERALQGHSRALVAIGAATLALAYAWLMNVAVERPLGRFRQSAIAALARERERRLAAAAKALV